MTIQEKLQTMLFECGLFENQAQEVVTATMNAKENECMKGRWSEPTENYPPVLLAGLWFSTKRHALEYIDKNMPKAWFRPMFTDENLGK